MSIPTIAISPLGVFPNESDLINQLFEAGLHRYHIHKSVATEQSIAEILAGIKPKFLGLITLHSHFHLVLAYGVGGIHYSLEHRKLLGVDYPSKVQLYQGFGVKVSTAADHSDWSPANYVISPSESNYEDDKREEYFLTKDLESIQSIPCALILDELLDDLSIEEIVHGLVKSQ